MLKISDRAKNVSPSLTLAITAKANKMKADGVDIVSFAAGEPDFNTPLYINEAAKFALDKGMTKYTPAAGTFDLRNEICNKLLKDNNLSYKAEQIIVSTGAKQSLFNVFQTIVQEGDEVIILSPYWLTYPELVKFCGAKYKIVDLTLNNFQLDLEKIEAAITDKTKAILMNSPNNPTGSVYEESSIRALAEMLKKYPDIWILSDEIYEKLIYDGKKHFSISSISKEIYDRTFVINGMSKAYSMTGWRVGYVACPNNDVAKAMSGIQSHQTSNPNSIAQYASFVALQGGKDFISHMTNTFDGRRQLMYEGLRNAPNISVFRPSGAFYLMLNVEKTFDMSFDGVRVASAVNLADLILFHAHVAVIPCEGFGAPRYIRLSYAASETDIRRGVYRIVEFLSKLK